MSVKKVYIGNLLTMLVFVMGGCSQANIPSDAQLIVTPANSSTSIISTRIPGSPCIVDPSRYMDIPLVLQLLTASGSPIGNSTVAVHTGLASNTFSQAPFLTLFNDTNSNGVIDGPSELISAKEDGIAHVVTDRWNGSAALLLRVNLSCGFSTEIHAIADGVSGIATVEVVEAPESVEPTETITPEGPDSL